MALMTFTRVAFTAALALGIAATSAVAQEAVRVASKIDTEGALLGNMIIQMLEANGIKTTNKLQLGPTNIVRSAIIAGEIDLYPEYTGNGAIFYSMDNDPVWRNAESGYQKIKALDMAQHKLAWLQPSPANNTWVIAVRNEVAKTNGLETMEDFARWVTSGGKVKIAASAEFVESPAALPTFQATYHFKLGKAQILALAGGNTAATIRAAAEGTSGVNAAMAYGTDGALASLNLVALADPKGAQVVYEPTPVVRAAVLEKYPRIAAALNPVFKSLDKVTLQSLNAKIAIEGQDPEAVAHDYLRSKDFAE